MKELDEAREEIGRQIAVICGENYDAYDGEDKESSHWWADKILSLKGDGWRLAVVKDNKIEDDWAFEKLGRKDFKRVIWEAKDE